MSLYEDAQRWTVTLALSGLPLSCGTKTPTPPEHPTTESSPKRPAAHDESKHSEVQVVLAVNSVSCGRQNADGPLGQKLEGDAIEISSAFQRLLGQHAVTLVNAPSEAELIAKIGQIPERSRIVFVYSGHGRQVHDTASNADSAKAVAPEPPDRQHGIEAPRSALCLRGADGGTAAWAVTDLVRSIAARKPTAALVIVSACESSYVDVSRVDAPVSVITVSPEEISSWGASPDSAPLSSSSSSARDAGAARDMTHVGRALQASLDRNAGLDANCDGWVSDRELFAAVTAALRPSADFLKANLVLPRLRRQADEPLPLWPSNSPCTGPTNDARAAVGDDLGERLARRARGEWSADNRVDYFYLQDADVHSACLGNTGFAATGSIEPAKAAELCALGRAAGWQALPLKQRADIATVETIARRVDFSEIYHLHLEHGWVHVDRLRDAHRVATHPEMLAPADLPRHDAVVARWPTGDYVVRFAGKVAQANAVADGDLKALFEQRDRIVAVCAEDEGQCFYVPARPRKARGQ